MNDPSDVDQDRKSKEIQKALEHLQLYTGGMVIIFPHTTPGGREYLRIESPGFPRPVADAILRHAAEEGMYVDDAESYDEAAEEE